MTTSTSNCARLLTSRSLDEAAQVGEALLENHGGSLAGQVLRSGGSRAEVTRCRGTIRG